MSEVRGFQPILGLLVLARNMPIQEQRQLEMVEALLSIQQEQQ
jgi:hypothetical protein